jgi:hypothetical protein
MYRTANLDREINDALENANNFDDLYYRLKEYDYSVGGVLNITMNRIFDISFAIDNNLLLTDAERVKLLQMFLDNGLDVNDNINNFSLGHSIVRSTSSLLINALLKSKFKFNSYTKVPAWHSLELLQLNLLGPSTDKGEQTELLKIIEKQLKKGVDLSSSTPKDFFEKLNRNYRSDAFKPLLALYFTDSYMMKFISDNMDVIVKYEFNNVLPEVMRDIFVF